MFRFLLVLLFLNFYTSVFSSAKENIIYKLNLTNVLSFDFIQTINEKNEKGSCIIKYPKKIFCKYIGSNKKIIVSNGKSLVIKNDNKGSYYIYPLDRTPLVLLLDKEFLISKMNILEPSDVDNKFLLFKIFENNNAINIFFDKKNFNLVGWQTEDIYQNLNITFISSVKINQDVDNKIFIIPKKN
jgi:outer membrane lipoprotein-sorting protein|tara:strand:+ start:34 stop:588 length:555 start_codon:yes stop_codon:yes gene_type:complete